MLIGAVPMTRVIAIVILHALYDAYLYARVRSTTTCKPTVAGTSLKALHAQQTNFPYAIAPLRSFFFFFPSHPLSNCVLLSIRDRMESKTALRPD
jgi:hypothetical protein